MMGISMDYSKLLGRIKEKGLTQRVVAEKIGVSESHFCQKLSGNFAFKQTEIKNLCEVLEINAAEIGLYFFTQNLEKSQYN